MVRLHFSVLLGYILRLNLGFTLETNGMLLYLLIRLLQIGQAPTFAKWILQLTGLKES